MKTGRRAARSLMPAALVLCALATAVRAQLGMPTIPPTLGLGRVGRTAATAAAADAAKGPLEPGQIGGGAAASTSVDAGTGLMPDMPNTCSHELSRKVRNILKDHVFPAAAEADYSLPLSCPLHPSLDRYRIVETEQREKSRGTHWKCKSCGKTFKTVHFLDAHFDRAHSDLLPAGATSCLADYCDIFGCDTVLPTHQLTRPSAVGGVTTPGASVVTPQAIELAANPRAPGAAAAQLRATQAAARAQAAANSRFASQISNEHHHSRACVPRAMEQLSGYCKQLFHKCFPPNASPAALKLHDRFVAEVCDSLRCVDARDSADASAAPSARSGVQRRAPSFAERAAAPASTEARTRLYWVLVGFVVLLLLMFYGGMYAYRSDVTFHSDLRRLKSSRQATRLAFWRQEKDKPF